MDKRVTYITLTAFYSMDLNELKALFNATSETSILIKRTNKVFHCKIPSHNKGTRNP
jgi:hypothetical protein